MFQYIVFVFVGPMLTCVSLLPAPLSISFFPLMYSPHQQKMFKVGASVIVIFLVLLSVACCYRKKLKACCSHCLGRQEEHEDQGRSNGDMTTKKKEETVDADGSNGTDSDKMADEGDEV